MLQRSVKKHDRMFISTNSTPVQLNTPNDPQNMSTSAVAAGSSDTGVNSIA